MRAPPRCSGPVGEGAKRRRGSGGSSAGDVPSLPRQGAEAHGRMPSSSSCRGLDARRAARSDWPARPAERACRGLGRALPTEQRAAPHWRTVPRWPTTQQVARPRPTPPRARSRRPSDAQRRSRRAARRRETRRRIGPPRNRPRTSGKPRRSPRFVMPSQSPKSISRSRSSTATGTSVETAAPRILRMAADSAARTCGDCARRDRTSTSAQQRRQRADLRAAQRRTTARRCCRGSGSTTGPRSRRGGPARASRRGASGYSISWPAAARSSRR